MASPENWILIESETFRPIFSSSKFIETFDRERSVPLSIGAECKISPSYVFFICLFTSMLWSFLSFSLSLSFSVSLIHAHAHTLAFLLFTFSTALCVSHSHSYCLWHYLNLFASHLSFLSFFLFLTHTHTHIFNALLALFFSFFLSLTLSNNLSSSVLFLILSLTFSLSS